MRFDLRSLSHGHAGRAACMAVTCACLAAASQAAAPATPNQFVILSDTQNIDGVDRMTREIIDLNPPFVVSVGDVPSSFDPRVDHFRRLREAGIEIHIAMGNHDQGPKQAVRSHLPPYPFNSEIDPIMRFVVDRKYYYSFNRGGIHFVITDTCTDNKELEIEWLRDDLLNHVNNPHRYPSLVFMHYPDWMMGKDVQTGGPIHRVLAEGPKTHTVKAAFAGHTHKGEAFPLEETNGVPLYTLYPSAPFGKDLQTEYVLVTVNADQITFERKVVLDDGKSGDFTIQPVKGTFTRLDRKEGAGASSCLPKEPAAENRDAAVGWARGD